MQVGHLLLNDSRAIFRVFKVNTKMQVYVRLRDEPDSEKFWADRAMFNYLGCNGTKSKKKTK